MEAHLICRGKEVDGCLMPLSGKGFHQQARDLDEDTPIARRLDKENKSAVSIFNISFMDVVINAESTGMMRAVGFDRPQISLT